MERTHFTVHRSTHFTLIRTTTRDRSLAYGQYESHCKDQHGALRRPDNSTITIAQSNQVWAQANCLTQPDCCRCVRYHCRGH